MNTRLLLIIITCLVIVPVLAFAYIRFTNQTLTNTPSTTLESQETVKKSTPTPAPSPISKPVPTTIKTVRGILSKIDKDNIVVSANETSETFSITTTQDFQRLTEGTIESGKGKTVPAKFEDLKVGQEVFVIAEKDNPKAKAVYILK